MKKIVLTLTAAIIFAWQGTSFAASSVDALIQKLEDKGILTGQEATQIKGEISSKEQDSQQATFKSLLPDWLNSMKLTGDFRLRDQYERRQVAGAAGSASNHLARNRGRLRARVNFEDQINDKVKVIVGIATNGENSTTGTTGNARSNNITFGGNNGAEGSFNKPVVVLNKAYAIYTPAPWATIMGGKMDNPIWEPVSPGLLWDPNITPEGGNIQLQKKLSDLITPFVSTSFFVLKDASPNVGAGANFKTDPYMMVIQGGIKGNLTDKVYYKAAASYYDFSNPSHIAFDNRPSTTASGQNNTNTMNGNSSTNYLYNYYVAGGAVELGMNDPFGELLPSPVYIPQIGIFGQYFQNTAISSQNSAWMGGAYMGNSAINGFGTWRLQSAYKVLARDSWLDVLPDADFYSGATDVEGWDTKLDIGLAKNTWFTFSWFRTQVYKPISNLANGGSTETAFSGRAPENLFQMDLNFKF